MALLLQVIMLCKDNPADVSKTVLSFPAIPPDCKIGLLVIDGSANSLEALILQVLKKSPLDQLDYCYATSLGVHGIYPSMNLALERLNSRWCL